MSKRILITGFGSFPGREDNPCTAMIDRLRTVFNGHVDTHQIIFMHLPTEYQRGLELLERTLHTYKPDLTICFGVHSGADGFRLERVARNQANIETPDNHGFTPIFPILEQSGQAQYQSTLPLDALQDALIAEAVDAQITEDAGGYLCNAAFYYLMRHIKQMNPHAIGGFIHIPDTDHDTLLKSARVVIETAANTLT